MVAHTADTYREAAKEHVVLAQRLHEELGEYGAAHYWAGLAVECMLRAYRVAQEPQFSSRHDLSQLVRDARFYILMPTDLQEELAAAVGEVAMRWRNDHRFLPSRILERWLYDQGLDPRVRGDRLKFNSRRVVNAALTVVQTGDRRWPFKTNSSSS
jgi:HEPN domain-containing protein